MSVAVHIMEKDRVGPSYEVPTEGDGLSDYGKIDQQVEIQKPGLHDVLLGRGGGTNNHTGNVKFRQLVNKHKMRYLACCKVEKPKVAREVVQLWHKLSPPGRFLQRKDETKKGPGSVSDATIIWIVVGHKKAREKASQCLRERTADVIPYLSQLRQQQDDMTHQGVTMVQHQMQMNGSGPGNAPAARRNSLVNMPDQPTYRVNSMNRRGSMPVATTWAMPVTPTSMEMQSRRGSMPAVSHMQGQTLNMQQLMARQQHVLSDAYSAIERSGGATPQQVKSVHMMGQQQLLVERQAMMHQQHSNLDERAMTQKNNTDSMMFQRDQMMRNNMMAQRNQRIQENAMIRANSMVQQYPPMLSPTYHRDGQSQQYAQMGRSPRGMQNFHPHMAQHQYHMASQRSPSARYNTTGQLPRDIQVPQSAGDDLEPLPYDHDEPIPLSMVPDAPLSTTPKFVSPDVAPASDELQQQYQYQQQQPTRRKDKIQDSSQVDDQDQNKYVDLQVLPLEYSQEHAKSNNNPRGKRSSMKKSSNEEKEAAAIDTETNLREYRKTLEDYITNHQIATPEVDIDDDVSEEGSGVEGIDASEWIRQTLNDSAETSLIRNKPHRRALNRENSKKSLMSGISTGTSYMSLALSDMEQSEDLSTREHTMSGARSSASTHSVMSEMTDFDELECL
jgi:hypothetical protein